MATNINFLSPIEFKLVLNRLPNVQFFIQAANVPGISSGVTERPTPFKDLYEPGDKLSYDDFVVTVVCDEDMTAYREIQEWLIALTSPESFSQYASLEANTPGKGKVSSTKNTVKSDGALVIMDSNKNPNIHIYFKGMFPTAVGSIQLSTAGTDVTPPTFDITFKYDSYVIEV